jgi:hypothetical protein
MESRGSVSCLQERTTVPSLKTHECGQHIHLNILDLPSRSSKLQKQYMRYVKTFGETCGSVVVKALCYKLEGRGFDTR